MFESIICIYLLIGLAHALAHIIQCQSCQRTAMLGLVAFVEFAVGWPIHAVEYVADSFRTPPKGLTKEEAEKIGEEVALKRIAEFKQSMIDSGSVIEVKQNPGESNEEFHIRAQKVMAEEMQKRSARKAGAA